MSNYLGENIPKLGFGLMRLPTNNDVIDIEHTKKMVDLFLKKGFTYFDTAYVYHGGKSECAMKEALIDRYPRESFQTASKLPIWDCENDADMERYLNESLSRAGLEYFDFYLLHALDQDRLDRAERIGAWDFVKRMKAEGKIKHFGFSFHDSADVLDKALEKHPEAEFVQLQLNYIDWENDDVQSKKCYEVAIKHNKPIIVMEPIKGGSLAALTKEAEAVLREAQPKLSTASWAMRYCASLKNIVTVLSGMSNIEQMEDNVSYMENFEPLSNEEQACITKAVEIINRIPTIPCTACKYCVDGCPQNINIPGIFSAMNYHKKFDRDPAKPSNMWNYNEAVGKGGKASDCIACGACEGQCPQHIAIVDELKAASELYEG